MNITLGIFKKVFAEFGSQLVAQMTTGTLTFNYKKINTDNTDYVSANNVYAKKEGDYPEGDYIQTVVWIDPVSGVTVQTGYAFGRVYGSPPSGTLPLEISTRDIENFILVGDKYVARLPQATICGGVHIQAISSVEYLVCYTISRSGGDIIVSKYKTVLDLNIDQTTIVPMPFDKSTPYTDTSGAQAISSILTVSNEMGSAIHGTPFDEYGYYFSAQNRNIVCNADGTKMAFAYSRKFNNEWKHYAIMELTDTELDFSIAEIEELDMTDEVIGVDSYTDVTSYPVTSITEQVDAPGDYTQPNPMHNGVNSVGNVASGSFTSTRTNAQTRVKTFLGVAYNRYTDELITAHEVHGLMASRKISIGDFAGSETDPSKPWSISLDYDRFNYDYEIIVNGSSTQFKIESAYNYSFTGSGDLGYGATGTGTYYQYYMTDFKMNVIDLSCLVFVVEYKTVLRNNWTLISEMDGEVDDLRTTFQSVINNGIETVLNEDITYSAKSGFPVQRPSFSGEYWCVSNCIIGDTPLQQTTHYQFDSHLEP